MSFLHSTPYKIYTSRRTDKRFLRPVLSSCGKVLWLNFIKHVLSQILSSCRSPLDFWMIQPAYRALSLPCTLSDLFHFMHLFCFYFSALVQIKDVTSLSRSASVKITCEFRGYIPPRSIRHLRK